MRILRRERITELLLRNTSLILFVAVFLFFGLQMPQFFAPESISNIVKQAAFTGIVAVGMTFVLLTAGIDLSVGSNMYLSALFAGMLMGDPGFGVVPALIAALMIGGLFGAINAFCIVRLKIAPFVVTLATLVAGRGLGTAITESHGVEYPRSLLDFGVSSVLGIPMPIIVFALVVVGAHFVLTRTAFGREVYAVGNDIEAAKKAGLNTGRIIAAVYIICGMMAALGGFILIAQIGRLTQPFARGKELDIIAAAVLGEFVRRRGQCLRRGYRLGADSNGAVGAGLYRGQFIPATDDSSSDYFLGGVLRQLARVATGEAQTPLYTRRDVM